MTAILASQRLQLVLCVTGLCCGSAAIADSEDAPDMAFLEYLGMWDETDEDWLLLEDETPAKDEEQDKSEAESVEAAEKKDEG